MMVSSSRPLSIFVSDSLPGRALWESYCKSKKSWKHRVCEKSSSWTRCTMLQHPLRSRDWQRCLNCGSKWRPYDQKNQTTHRTWLWNAWDSRLYSVKEIHLHNDYGSCTLWITLYFRKYIRIANFLSGKCACRNWDISLYSFCRRSTDHCRRFLYRDLRYHITNEWFRIVWMFWIKAGREVGSAKSRLCNSGGGRFWKDSQILHII